MGASRAGDGSKLGFGGVVPPRTNTALLPVNGAGPDRVELSSTLLPSELDLVNGFGLVPRNEKDAILNRTTVAAATSTIEIICGSMPFVGTASSVRALMLAVYPPF